MGGDGWVGIDGQRLSLGAASAVRLWHPADADDVEISAWWATLAAATLEQPVKQVHREVFRPAPRDFGLAAEIGCHHGARTLDAVHLAAADRLPRPLVLLTFDRRQADAARSMELAVEGV